MRTQPRLRVIVVFVLFSANATGALAQSLAWPPLVAAGHASAAGPREAESREQRAAGTVLLPTVSAAVEAAARHGVLLSQASGDPTTVKSGPGKKTIVAIAAALAGTVAVAAWIGQKRSQAALSSGSSGGSCSSRVTVRSAGGLFETMSCRF